MTGEELRRIRVRMDLSREKFAKLVGASDAGHVYKWETERRRIPETVVILLGIIMRFSTVREALGVSIERRKPPEGGGENF